MGWRDRAKPADTAAAIEEPKPDWRARAKPAESVVLTKTTVQAPAPVLNEAPPEDPSLLEKGAEWLNKSIAGVTLPVSAGAVGTNAHASADAAMNVLHNTIFGGENFGKGPSPSYDEYKKAFQKQYDDEMKALRKENPVATPILETGGEVLPYALAPGTKLPQVAKALPKAAQFGVKLLGDSAVQSGVGAGQALAKGGSLEDAAENAAWSGGGNLVFGAGLKGAGALSNATGFTKFIADQASKHAGELQTQANYAATKASGIIKKYLDQLPRGAAQEIGQTLLDRGLIKPGQSLEDALRAVMDLSKRTGKDIGGALSKADEATGGTGREVRDATQLERGLMEKELLSGADNYQAAAKRAEQTAVQNADSAARAADTEARSRVAELKAALGDESQRRAADNLAAEAAAAEAVKNRLAGLEYTPTAEMRSRLEDQFRREAAEQFPVKPDVDTAIAASPKTEALFRESALASQPTLASKDDLLKQYLDPATLGPLPNEAAELAALPEAKRAVAAKSAAAKAVPAKGGFDLNGFISDVRRELGDELKDPTYDSLRNDIEKKLMLYAKKAEKGVSVTEANVMKGRIQKTISKWLDSNAKQGMSKDMQRLLGDRIESTVAKHLSPEEAANYLADNKLYGQLQTVKKGLNNALSVQEQAAAAAAASPRSQLKDTLMGSAAGGSIGTAIDYLFDSDGKRSPATSLGGTGVGALLAYLASKGKAPPHYLDGAARQAVSKNARAAALRGLPEALKLDPSKAARGGAALGPQVQEFLEWLNSKKEE